MSETQSGKTPSSREESYRRRPCPARLSKRRAKLRKRLTKNAQKKGGECRTEAELLAKTGDDLPVDL
jgi:hypothetical protein